jgi:hypothetical protein
MKQTEAVKFTLDDVIGKHIHYVNIWYIFEYLVYI